MLKILLLILATATTLTAAPLLTYLQSAAYPGPVTANVSSNEIIVSYPISASNSVAWTLRSDPASLLFGIKKVSITGAAPRDVHRPGSQTEYAFNVQPITGGPVEDVGGELHGNERRQSINLSSNQTSFRLEQTSLITHRSKPIARCDLVHEWTNCALTVSYKITAAESFKIPNMQYSAMWPLLLWDSVKKEQTFDRLMFNGAYGERSLVLNLASGQKSAVLGQRATDGIMAFGRSHPFFAAITQPDALEINQGFTNAAQKVFVTANPSSVADGTSQLLKVYFQRVSSGKTNIMETGHTFSAKTIYMVGENPPTSATPP